MHNDTLAYGASLIRFAGASGSSNAGVPPSLDQPTNNSERPKMSSPTADLSIVVPTFNERENVAELVRRLTDCLSGVAWEVIFVDDDSPDGTADVIRGIALENPRVRCIQRIGRRGLSSACVEGMLASAAPYLAVMDADLQHDETLLRGMTTALKEENVDIVVGSRYVEGGGIADWDKGRAKMSQFATRLSRYVVKQDLSDPMSGFFALRRDVLVDAVRNLSNIGFKILLDILASASKPLRLKELPYEFRTRHAGESKLDSQAVWGYLMLLGDKMFGHIVPVRFVAFSAVGGLGVVVHFVVLTLLFQLLALPFTLGQAVATTAAMVSNFALNNALTYRDMRLRGWRWLLGLASFMLVCSLGAFANVGIASYLFVNDTVWVLAAMAGIVVGAVWNYAVTAIYTWRKA
jgi:dolichol-phosphate mannosyltransferase